MGSSTSHKAYHLIVMMLVQDVVDKMGRFVRKMGQSIRGVHKCFCHSKHNRDVRGVKAMTLSY